MPEDSFKEFVLDQLSALPDLRVQAMFGGHGLYQAEQFFGLLMEGRLYFKTDVESRTAYLERGMGPFIYEKARRTLTMHYYEVPPEVLEGRDDLIAWANRAVRVASSKPKKSARRLNPRVNQTRNAVEQQRNKGTKLE